MPHRRRHHGSRGRRVASASPVECVGTLRGVQYLMPECQTLRVTRRATEGGGRVRDFVQQSRAGAESTEPNMCAGVARPLTIPSRPALSLA